MTPEERAEPLPDMMYSRDVAVRIMRHAIWYLMFPDKVVTISNSQACHIIANTQMQVTKMSTGDFFRIKKLGSLQHKMNVCPCICHYTQTQPQPCDTCKGLHISN